MAEPVTQQLTLDALDAEAKMPPVGSTVEVDGIGRWLRYTVESREITDEGYAITCTAVNPLPQGHWPSFRVRVQGWAEDISWRRVNEGGAFS